MTNQVPPSAFGSTYRVRTYPGYRSVVVEAAMTVDTREFSWLTVGLLSRSRSTAMEFNAVLSNT